MAPDEVSGQNPLVVLERVERYPDTPNRMAGTVRLSGHPGDIELQFMPQYLGFISSVKVPKLLELHEPSRRAVVMAMNRIHNGDEVSLPLDLTEEIRDADPPYPFEPMDPAEQARLDAGADAVDVHVNRVEWAPPGTDPPLVVADLVVDGVPMTLRLWLWVTPGAETVMLRQVDPQQPEPSLQQLHAIERALLAHRKAG